MFLILYGIKYIKNTSEEMNKPVGQFEISKQYLPVVFDENLIDLMQYVFDLIHLPEKKM
jgi:hypothetical protein